MLPYLVAIVAGALVTWGLYAAIVSLHRWFSVVEYGMRLYVCPACGRRCYGVRRRRSPGERWSEWRSSCCEVPLAQSAR